MEIISPVLSSTSISRLEGWSFELRRLCDQVIRCVALRGYDDNNLVARLCRFRHNVRHVFQTFGICYRGSAKFLQIRLILVTFPPYIAYRQKRSWVFKYA